MPFLWVPAGPTQPAARKRKRDYAVLLYQGAALIVVSLLLFAVYFLDII